VIVPKTIKLDTPGSHQVILGESDMYIFELTVPGIELEVVGIYQLSDKEQKELSVTIHHQAPHTRARTTLKGVARDRSFLKLSGRIIIDENCGDTNSFLTEKILLLSDHARAEAIPDLEILSDDVKCSHAATIGQIPAEQLFYLMSRGLSKTQAEDEIVSGFLADVL
jgi:Fe-S cluster assembly protein SufD